MNLPLISPASATRKILRRTYMKVAQNRPLRHALEIRHESFRRREFIKLLREHDVARWFARTTEWPMDLTSDLLYCRLHGSQELYACLYDRKGIEAWAQCAVAWAGGRDPKDAERVIQKPATKRSSRHVYIYSDNDAKVPAPGDALSLIVCLRKVQSDGSD
jgi:uncharacterized protein YecE (DUF72 family)